MRINILDFLYSCYFNYRVFPLNLAVKMPILISRHTKVEGLHRGCIKIDGKVNHFMILIGIERGTGDFLNYKKSYFYVEKGTTIFFSGYSSFCAGVFIASYKGAKIKIGNGCWFNTGCSFRCSNKIEIGSECLCGWNVSFRDSDGHSIYSIDNKETTNIPMPIEIGDKVWIGADSVVSKGGMVGNSSIVAGRSLVNKKYVQKHVILAGTPAKIVRDRVDWNKKVPIKID